MPEGFELPEGGKDNPLVLPVSITVSILAVLIAAVTLMGHRSSTEELLLQARASDQWSYFQAKNIRLHEMQSVADLLGALSPADKEKTAQLHEKYLQEVERYTKDKEDISAEAKGLERERDVASHRGNRFDAGEGLLEVGLVICSVTLLTDRKIFWYSGMLIGAVGVATALTGFLLH